MKPIRIWRFDDAPKRYQKLSTNGGDEDWLAFVPQEYEKTGWLLWLDGIDSCNDPLRYAVKGGSVYIGCHA